jgi:hypothetical protein
VFRNLLLWKFVLVFFGFGGQSIAEAVEVQSGRITSIGPGSQFAIVDFDGDVRPDLASIQAGPNRLGTTDYWIRSKLSARHGWVS